MAFKYTISQINNAVNITVDPFRIRCSLPNRVLWEESKTFFFMILAVSKEIQLINLPANYYPTSLGHLVQMKITAVT
jgi:hypothetical protein